MKIGEYFRLPGTIYSYDTITLGNINATYKVTYRNEQDELKSYLFQRVNTHVFKNPVEIMLNIEKVTSFLRANYPDQMTLHFHHTEDGLNYYIGETGFFWRVSNYIDSITFDMTEDLDIILAAGEAFGHFQMQLSAFDGTALYETIPHFHNTKMRLDTLFSAAEADICGRRHEVETELEYISSVRDLAADLSIRYTNGEFPIRVTHNDTKANNVLFDRVTKKPITVIDLDTVMPGLAIYDFGDAVRFIANTSVEDEPDLTKVVFDSSKFRAFAKGFIKEVKDAWTEDELRAVVLATYAITIEQMARFLTDYLEGDTYFRINYPMHNLVRTRCQMQLAKDIQRKWDELEKIVLEVREH